MQVLEQMQARRVFLGVRPVTDAAREVLLGRAASLDQADRSLMEMIFRHKLSLRDVSQIVAKPPGTLCRKVQRLCARLRDPMVAALLDDECDLAAELRQLGV